MYTPVATIQPWIQQLITTCQHFCTVQTSFTLLRLHSFAGHAATMAFAPSFCSCNVCALLLHWNAASPISYRSMFDNSTSTTAQFVDKIHRSIYKVSGFVAPASLQIHYSPCYLSVRRRDWCGGLTAAAAPACVHNQLGKMRSQFRYGNFRLSPINRKKRDVDQYNFNTTVGC